MSSKSSSSTFLLFSIIFGILLLFILVTCRSQFDLYLLGILSTFSPSKISSFVSWSKRVYPAFLLKNFISINLKHFLSHSLRVHSYKIGTWNIRTLKQGGKLEKLKTEMRKNKVSVLGVSEVRWTGQGAIRSGDYTVYFSVGEWAERDVAIVVHKIIVRSVVNPYPANVENRVSS